jgi:hypothetical protein
VDTTFLNIERTSITALAVALLLVLLLRVLRRRRPTFSIALPLAVGYLLRLLVIAGVSATGLGSSLRGFDESTFMTEAHQIALLPWTSSQWLPTAHTSFLHILVFAAQLKLLGSAEAALRITQVGISLAGAVLIAAAVYDLAGARAARLTAWLLSLEVASLFFNSLLHKEPNMELATGLLVFGGAQVWRKLELKGVALMGFAGLLGLGTRHYVGWFLFACAILVTLHAALRQMGGSLRSLPVIYAVAGIVFVATPAVLELTSRQSLQKNLQTLQTGETTTSSGNGSPNGNNLALEQVDFSTRGAVITNLPLRIRDVLFRPYPWQVGDLNQALGVAGSLIALTCWFLLIRYAFLVRGDVFRRAGPLLYPFFFLLVAYALAVGNAGTGFRYRTHLVTLGLAAMVVLRDAAAEPAFRKVSIFTPARPDVGGSAVAV